MLDMYGRFGALTSVWQLLLLLLLHRYKKAADWTLLSGLVQENPSLPIIGNGDILTHYEAADRCVADLPCQHTSIEQRSSFTDTNDDEALPVADLVPCLHAPCMHAAVWS